MTMLDAQTAVVFNTADLRDAVSTDNGIDHVYFGADIALAYGVRIYSGKASLLIDGFYDGVMHTFTDMDSDGQGDTLYISGATSIEITVQNMILVGRNWYGIPSIYENTGTRDLSVTYINVKYTGRQMTFNRNGLTRYIDCDITITPTTKVSQEVGEVCRVEIGGTTIMNHNDTNDSTFWFPTSSTEKYLKILKDANVAITTMNDLMYTDYTAVAYTLEQGASFALYSNNGFSRGSSHRASSFLVDENASFKYIQTTNNGTNASIYISGALTVRKGASFYMQADYTASAPLIRFVTTSSSFNVENPKSFVLYKRNTPALSFESARPFSFSGGQLNYWSAAMTPLTVAGTFADIPQSKWNKPDWSAFSMSGTSSASITTVASHSFTAEELAKLPPLGNLMLYYARVLSIGDLPLAVNTVIVGNPITGKTDPDAHVKAEYTASGTPYSPTALADQDGSFIITAIIPVPLAANVEVSSNIPFLITTITKTAEDEGALFIEDAPTLIRFVTPPVSLNPLLLRRAAPIAPMRVTDTRADSTEWELVVSIDGPMSAQSGHTLPDAVVFVEGGNMEPLRSDAQIPVLTGGPDVPETPVIWNDDEGILLNPSVPVHNKQEYTARLTWEVHPINP